MEEYVITIGSSGLPTWWHVAIVAIFAAMYIIANVIPATVFLYMSIRERDFDFYTPLAVLFLLLPFIGSLIGLAMYQEIKWVMNTILALTYALIIAAVVCIVEMY